MITLTTLRADALTVDPSVQRETDPKRAQRYAAAWQDAHAGVLVVSKRKDGSHVLLDGGHRWLAATAFLEEPAYLFRCEVHEGLTKRQEAALSLALNGEGGSRKQMEPFNRYRLGLVSGLKDCLAIEAILSSHDLRAGSSAGPGVIGAVNALRTTWAASGPDALAKALEDLEAAYGRDRDTWKGEVIQAVAAFHAKWGEDARFNRKSFVKALAPSGDQLLNTATARMAGGGGSASRWREILKVLEERYNSGRKSGRLS